MREINISKLDLAQKILAAAALRLIPSVTAATHQLSLLAPLEVRWAIKATGKGWWRNRLWLDDHFTCEFRSCATHRFEFDRKLLYV
jgi:hypothetical protein